MDDSILILHAHEERPAADALSQWMTERGHPREHITLLSEPQGGTLTPEELERARQDLAECDLAVALVSGRTLMSPWMHFLAGSAWVWGTHVIVACHQGLGPEAIRPPLAVLEVVDLDDGPSLAHAIGIPVSPPPACKLKKKMKQILSL